MNTPYLVTKPENLDPENNVIDEKMLGLVVDFQKITTVLVDEVTKLPSQTESVLLCVVWPHQPGTSALTFYAPEALCFVELYDQNAEYEEDQEGEEDDSEENFDDDESEADLGV